MEKLPFSREFSSFDPLQAHMTGAYDRKEKRRRAKT